MQDEFVNEKVVLPTRPIHIGFPPRAFPLIAKKTLVASNEDPVIHPVRRFTFGYPADQSLGFNLGLGDHLKVVVPGLTKPRSYSPTSDPKRKGSFDLTVKIYSNGRCSQWLDSLKIGAKVRMFGKLPMGTMMQLHRPGPHLFIIALGIGITEGFPVMQAQLERDSITRVTLIYSVRYSTEVVFTQDIDDHQRRFPGRVFVKRIATREKVDGWHHGHANEEFLQTCLVNVPASDARFLVVGTKSMIKSMWKALRKLGYRPTKHALLRKPLKPM